MTLQDILDQLNSGELYNVNLGMGSDSDPNTVDPENYERLVRMINLGLVNLYSRFKIKKDEVVISLQDGVYQYELSSKHSVNKPSRPNLLQYILDTKNKPFKDNILNIEYVSVFRSDTEKEYNLPIDKLYLKNSVETRGLNTLYFPKDIIDATLAGTETKKYDKALIQFRCQAEQIKVGLGYFDPSRIEVELPYAYLEALCYFIASRVNTITGFSEGINPADYFYKKYEMACMKISDSSIYLTSSNQGEIFNKGGWV